MIKYIVKNHNGTVIFEGSDPMIAAREMRDYQRYTGNICIVEQFEVAAIVSFEDYKNCVVSFHNKFYIDATDAEEQESLHFAAMPSALDNFDIFSDLCAVLSVVDNSDTTYGFVNSRGEFIDFCNIQKDGEKSPREIIEGMTA